MCLDMANIYMKNNDSFHKKDKKNIVCTTLLREDVLCSQRKERKKFFTRWKH